MKNINEIAYRLVELLKEKKFLETQQELFDQDVISQEPEEAKSRSVNGLESVLLKESNFLKNIKLWRNFEVSEPIISKDFFSIRMFTEVVLMNDREVSIDEIIVYEVRDGKIVKEQFFYKP
jgi:16S rRNA A1518/A1519 N6-dimethyltransferase RsmA/KsgA/DIM1 with predicted DNA glycosylase/AP lyase activity